MKHPLTDAGLAAHLAVLGRTGSGKTYTAKGLVEGVLKKGAVPVCVVDPGGDWWGLRANRDGKRAGFPIAVLGGEHADLPIDPGAGERVGEFVAGEGVSCVVDVSEWTKSEQLHFMRGFAESVFLRNRRPLHLVLDEADQWCPQNPLPETKVLVNRMDQIVRMGRKRGFRVMMITQRPAVIHKNVLAQINSLIVLQLTSPQDRKAIEDWVKGNADADQGKAMLKTLARLKQGEGWAWEPQSDRLERMQFPAITTFDAGSTPIDGPRAEPKRLADVDLDALRAAFTEPEPAEDPVEQPTPAVEASRIADLERLLAKERAQLAHYEAMRAEYYQSTRELAAAIGHLQSEVMGAIAPVIQPIAAGLERVLQTLSSKTPTTTPTPSPAAAPPPAGAPGLTITIDGLKPGARKLLDGFASLYPQTCTPKQAATRAGQSVKSSAFRINVRELEELGLIEMDGRSGRITAAGLEVTGTAPIHAGAALGEWMNRLPSSQARLLKAIQAHGPISKDDAAQRADISATSSGLGSGLRKLIDLALIERDGGGRYKLCEGLK